MIDEPTPSRELLLKKVRDMFPEQLHRIVLKTLGARVDAFDPVGQARVQLAVLKLSEGDLQKLRQWAATAALDFRDALTYAEYPEQMRSWNLPPDGEAGKEARARDREQYLRWLRGGDQEQ